MSDAWLEVRTGLRRFVARRVSDDAVADDLLQEIFLRFEEQQHTLRSPRAVTGWLYRIASNLIVDHYRERSRFRALPEELPQPSEEKNLVGEMAACMLPLVAELPEIYRQAVQLSELDGLGHKEIAQRLGLSISGVKSRVQRGRGMLLKRIEQCCELERGPRGVVGYERRSQ